MRGFLSDREYGLVQDVREVERERDTLRSDLARVTAERDALQSRLDDYYDDHRAVVAGQCAPDEKHCSCVPHLRREVEAMRGVEAAARATSRTPMDQMLPALNAIYSAVQALDAIRTRKVGG